MLQSSEFCDFWDFHSGFAEDSVLWDITLRRSVRSSSACKSQKINLIYPNCMTRFVFNWNGVRSSEIQTKSTNKGHVVALPSHQGLRSTTPWIPRILNLGTGWQWVLVAAGKYYTTRSRNAQIVQRSGSHLSILGSTKVTSSKFHDKGSQILGAIVQKLVATANWRQGYKPLI
jgi:hypothetical protein